MRYTIEMRFVDSNILLYAASKNPDEQDKAGQAKDILNALDLALSVQVLQEFYAQATRTTRADRLSHLQATLLIRSFCRYPVQETTLLLVEAALRTTERFQISYWDAAIIEAARTLGCREILSEDLGDGQDYGGVRVTNPFRAI
ncbi:MAG TPA: PIN domain-containing protein [Bryobacteraceae bacterium]|nr:PIN domain-containing protein [Bryobacteraceae bacterium]